jgi:hypothetical protein
MFYGSDKGGAWRTYAAQSNDGFRFQKVHGDTPIMEQAPAGSFDTAGRGRNHVAHPTQFVVTGDKVRLWYMGEDGTPPHYQRIGLMEAVWR